VRLPPPQTAPATIAHRGASVIAPENTLAAVRAAIDLGATAVEIDVHRARDGALVVLHDCTLARTTDVERQLPARGPWWVGDLTYDEIARLDAGSWHDPAYAGERVPLLRDVLQLLRSTGTGLLLEVKKPELYPGIESDLTNELRAVPGYLPAALSDRGLVVQSFDHRSMARFKRLAADVPVGLLGTLPRRQLARAATWVDHVNPRHRGLTASYVTAVHEAGLSCYAWTVDRPADLARVVALGVDGVVTNRPELLRSLLDRPARSAA
jgi:glycerophosphoryl diester phosphodiesterase